MTTRPHRASTIVTLMLFLAATHATAQEENASNPLAKVKNTDIRLQYFDLGNAGHVNDLYIDGLAGFGGHKQFDWGVGGGVRFSY